MRWTVRVVRIDGRQVFQVRQDGLWVGQYGSVDELRADPKILVDVDQLEEE